MSIIRGLILRLIFLFCILLGCVCCALTTNNGLKLTIGLTNIFLPGKITAQGLEGSLWKHLSCNIFSYKNKQQQINIHNLNLNWHLVSIYPLNIALDNFIIKKIHLKDNAQAIDINKINLNGKLQKKLSINATSEVIIPQGTLNINALIKDNYISSKFSVGVNKATLQGPLFGPWHINANIPKLSQLHNSLQDIESNLVINATIQDKNNATISAKMYPGRYNLPPGSTPKAITFKGLTLNSDLKSEQLNLRIIAELDNHTQGFAKLTLDKFNIEDFSPTKQAVKGKVKLQMNSMQFLEGVYDLGEVLLNVQNPKGSLIAEIDFDGFLNKPAIKGKITLENGSVELPEFGLNIKPLELAITSNGTSWDATGLIKSNDSESLILNGKGKISPSPSGELSIDGREFITINTPEYHIKTSPHINLTFKDNAYNIYGNIIIPEATISPLSFTNTQKLTSDAVLEEKKEPSDLNLHIDLGLKMGQNVKVDAYGIHGNIDGALQINQEPKQALDLNGKLRLQNGKYEYYGQKLNISQGEVVFLGKQIDNPNIQVRATRKFSSSSVQMSGSNRILDFSAENLDTANFGSHTTVGIAVTGRAKSPKIKLYSNPASLSQQDILSLLLFGKRSDQIGSSGGQILIKALSSMNVGSDSKAMQILKKYKKSLGIDIDVQNNSLGTTNTSIAKTKVSVGKSITKRVYLKYSDGLFQENSGVLTLTYLLNKFLSIKVTDSDIGNGIDITYEHSE